MVLVRSAYLALVLIVPSIAFATITKRFTLTELRQNAATIVLADVTRIDYRQINGRIWTIVTVHVEKSFKGSTPPSMRFKIPGGQHSVNGRTLVTRVDGVPVIQASEKAIFFLEQDPPAYPGLLGWEQGLYRVVRRNGKAYAVRSDHSEPPQELNLFLQQLSNRSKDTSR